MTKEKKGRLADKVAIVTGGASGIGAATCRVFAEEAAQVVLVDIQETLGRKLAQDIQGSGGTIEFFRADMGVSDEIRAMIRFAVQRFGRLDILVNNAAVESPKAEVDTTEEEWDHIMNVNVKGVFVATKHAIPEMKKNGGGSIINISSAYGIIGSTGFAAYHASKGAVRLFTKATAVAHAREGIRANSIHPGAVDTPLLREAISRTADPKAVEELFAQSQPIGRLGKPEEIAFGCLYLASDESKFCIGTELSIDGGMVAQ